jgi:hypothetical protein
MTRRSYPRLMRHWENAPVEAIDGDWVSQLQAAESLGVGIWRVGFLLANGHLSPANAPNGEAGVTVDSLKTEAEWRRHASVIRRMVRPLKDCFNWI